MSDPQTWNGTLYLGEGWMIYAGPLGTTARHAHHAVQVLAAPDGVTVDDGNGRRSEGPALVVPANAEHSLEAHGQPASVAYLDPLSIRVSSEIIELRSDLPTPPARFEDIAAARRWAELTAAACGGRSRSTCSDVVAAAMAEARRRLHATLRLGEVAAALGFAPSTITHRFTAEVGIPFRRWVLWERLQLAAGAVRRGDNLTTAAHAAGFADSAHLNRTFRSMFGLTPSDIAGVVRWEVETRPERSSP